MNQPTSTVEDALTRLRTRLEAMNSTELGRVAEEARAGRTAVWRLRQGRSNAGARTVVRIERAVNVIEAERPPTPTTSPCPQEAR